MNNLQYNINALKKIVVSDLIKKMAVYFTFYFLLVIMIFYNVEYITMDYFEFLLSTSLLNIYGLLDVVSDHSCGLFNNNIYVLWNSKFNGVYYFATVI